jgi:hypothetical protein
VRPGRLRLGVSHVRPGWIRRCLVAAVLVAVGIVTVTWTLALVERGSRQGELGDDFKTSVWSPDRALLDGQSPLRHYSDAGHDGGTVYQPIAALVTLPFSLPPYAIAGVLWTFVLVLAVVGALWACGVRDWRCYVAACGSPPVVAGLVYGNVSLVLVLAVALAWRLRDRPWGVAALLGLVVAAKLFLWPLVVWLAITRRYRACALAVASGVAFVVVGWATVGFEGLSEYPSMLARHAAENDQDGVSIAALGAQLGLPGNQVLALAAGVVALWMAWRNRALELGAFAWAVTAALLASPMVWWHYYALLLVPIALAAPRWRLVWLAPYAMFPQAADAVVGTALSAVVAVFASSVDPAASVQGGPGPDRAPDRREARRPTLLGA